MVEFTLDGRPASAQEGELLVHARGPATASSSPPSATTTSSSPTAAAASASSTSRAAPRPLPACATRVREGMVVSTNASRAAAAEDADRDAALRAPERRPGRPAERARRPGRGARRRGAAHPPRREARAVRGPQPADGLRPRRLHPLQPLRPLHAGGDAVLGALARGPRAGGADRADLGQALARHRVRALRRLPLRLPDRRDLREVRCEGAGVEERALEQDEDDLHVLRRRLPDRPQRRPGDEADRQGHLRPELRLERGQPLRQGPLRLQLRPPPRPPDRAARPRRGRRAAPDDLGARARGRRRRACRG